MILNLLQHYKLKALERARIFETKNTVFSVEDKLTEVVRDHEYGY